MENVESVSKKFKSQLFWSKTGQKFSFGKNYYNTPPNWMVFHRLLQKYKHLQAYCKDGTQKYTHYPLKNPKIELFIANNSLKKNGPPKIWSEIDRETVIVFMQKSDKSTQKVPRKLHSKRWNAEGCHGREGNEIILTCLCAKRFRSARLKKLFSGHKWCPAGGGHNKVQIVYFRSSLMAPKMKVCTPCSIFQHIANTFSLRLNLTE